MSSLQERVESQQKKAPQQDSGQLSGQTAGTLVPPLSERSASDIRYVKLLGFSVQIGPGTQGQIDNSDATFAWSRRGTLLVRDRANGDEFEFHPSQFTVFYQAISGWRREPVS